MSFACATLVRSTAVPARLTKANLFKHFFIAVSTQFILVRLTKRTILASAAACLVSPDRLYQTILAEVMLTILSPYYHWGTQLDTFSLVTPGVAISMNFPFGVSGFVT